MQLRRSASLHPGWLVILAFFVSCYYFKLIYCLFQWKYFPVPKSLTSISIPMPRCIWSLHWGQNLCSTRKPVPSPGAGKTASANKRVGEGATGIRTVLSDGTKTKLSDVKRISLWASRLVILEAVSNWSAEGKSMLLEEVVTWRSPSLVKNTSGWGHLLCDSLMGHWSESFQALNCLPCHLNCKVFWQALQLQSQSFVREHASD